MTASRPLLVATDVDGTLIGNDHLVPAANLAVIEDIAASGATFVLATGRPPRWMSQIVDQLPFAPLAVCANGAVIMDTDSGEFLSSTLLQTDVLVELDQVLGERLPGCGIAAERLGRDAADAQFVASPDYEHAWISIEHLEVGHDEVLSEPVLKLLARMPGMSSADMAAAVSGAVEHLADVTYSTTDGLIEFAPRGVTKASGLGLLTSGELSGGSVLVPASGGAADREGVGGEGARGAAAPVVPVTVAFGDMPNDVEMLRWADHGVAMGNAIPSVRAVADEVTLSNDDAGLAHVLRRWWT
ncbi:haloacid dehalogenase [Dietzia sp. NCCP-2495]|uniref:HAD family hydrolase n=1 Tax=Dietzia sp. NCCP-2495 TaxID=2934675 RepID=UPI00222E84F7|nr:HAD family hydrolase [Dietzia sp. NCCP-2495]GLB64373.1 haloacid dehalogenase [Dietzia sp. NCCP-2495]